MIVRSKFSYQKILPILVNGLIKTKISLIIFRVINQLTLSLSRFSPGWGLVYRLMLKSLSIIKKTKYKIIRLIVLYHKGDILVGLL